MTIGRRFSPAFRSVAAVLIMTVTTTQAAPLWADPVGPVPPQHEEGPGEFVSVAQMAAGQTADQQALIQRQTLAQVVTTPAQVVSVLPDATLQRLLLQAEEYYDGAETSGAGSDLKGSDPVGSSPPTGSVSVSRGSGTGVVLTISAPDGTEAQGAWKVGEWGGGVAIHGTETYAIAAPPWEPGPQQFIVRFRAPGDGHPWSDPVSAGYDYQPTPSASQGSITTRPKTMPSGDSPTSTPPAAPPPTTSPPPPSSASYVPPGETPPASLSLQIERRPTEVQLTIVGAPGTAFHIEAAEAVTGPWISLGSGRLDASGTAQLVDSRPPADRQFYRAVTVIDDRAPVVTSLTAPTHTNARTVNATAVATDAGSGIATYHWAITQVQPDGTELTVARRSEEHT